MKLAKVMMSTELLEAILSAKNNDFVTTNCPDDVRIVRVCQDAEDQANNRVILVLESEEADWDDVGKAWSVDNVPMIDPFEYTVVDPDESPPPTEEKSDG
jgi:hypothetical protein